MARILVIEDDPQYRSMLQEMLEKDGHEVTTAADGMSGIACYREQGADIVITDILMPKKSGSSVITELLQHDPGVNIIAISGGGSQFSAEGYLEFAHELGARRVLSKPVAWDELRRGIAELLPGG